MFQKRMLAVLLLLACVGISAHAQPPTFLAGGWTCEDLKAACNDQYTVPDDAYQAAFIAGPGATPYFGTCYVHDKSTCPNCFCWDYVKVSYYPDPKGYDGGTGCIGYPNIPSQSQSRAMAGATLLELCKQGKCCCPEVPSSCTSITRARDLVTGSCCNFCSTSVPSGWTTSISPGDCH